MELLNLPKIVRLKIETPEQKNLIENIKLFNKLKNCSCCERHSTKKPVDMNDFRMGNRFNEGDSRNITGIIELVADDEKIDTMVEKHPRVHVFQNTSQNCQCNCRQMMRSIVRDPFKNYQNS